MKSRFARAIAAIVALCVCAYPAVAGGFGILIELPNANNPAMKDAFLVVRPIGCHGPGSKVTARAEGLVNGVRRAVEVKLTKVPKASGTDSYDTYTLKQQWPKDGAWVLIATAEQPFSVNGKAATMSINTLVEFDAAGQPKKVTFGAQKGKLMLLRIVKPSDVEGVLKSMLAHNGGKTAG